MAESALKSDVQKDKIVEAVRLIRKCNFIPIALTLDQHPTNVKMVAELNATKENPVFYVDGEGIVVLYDTPHILKSIRNNLFQKNLLIDDQIVSSKHIRDLYEHDINNIPRLAPKFERKCLLENPLDKMNVAAMASVFSRTTSIAMNTYVTFGKMQPDALPTANFLNRMDSFFDCFNSNGSKNPNKVIFLIKYHKQINNLNNYSR